MNPLLLATHLCRHPAPRLDEGAITGYLNSLPAWTRQEQSISREFSFADHHQLMAFLNAVAWISHHANHHPDVQYGYKNCRLSYSTHDAGGLTENDFICAAKVDILQAI